MNWNMKKVKQFLNFFKMKIFYKTFLSYKGKIKNGKELKYEKPNENGRL